MNEYLWDGSGAPDAGIEQLEKRLAPLRFQPSREWRPPRRAAIPYGAIAASFLVGALAWRLCILTPSPTNWEVTVLDGQVNIAGRAAVPSERLRPGQTVHTGTTARVTIENDDFGQVDLAPLSKLTMMGSKSGRETMSLERGTLHAYIWAPPRQFVVDTPYARTIDLGCEYTLTVDESGDGLVSVELGWVAFQFGEQESFIPEGANCRTSEKRGPGIPFYRDAQPSFLDALAGYEKTGDAHELERLLAVARPQDALTLWHLQNRVPPAQRAAVFDRFAQLVKLPASVERMKVLARDPATMDACWNALELDDANWWREWKREWKPRR